MEASVTEMADESLLNEPVAAENREQYHSGFRGTGGAASSVISAMSEPDEHAKFGYANGALSERLDEASSASSALVPNRDVPLQVILSVDSADPDASLAPLAPLEAVITDDSDEPPLIVTTTTPEIYSTVSMSAVPDRQSELSHETTRVEHARTTKVDARTEDGLDDYIRSPEVQNAIVERSPGGRYVRFMEKLGSGASKDVYRAYDTQEGIEVAWNVVNLSGVPKTERNRIVNEVRLLERLHHQNIISFHGSWVNRERQEVNFVTEILSSGTLKSFITKVQVIRWKIAKRWATQILNGLDYLHSQEPPIIHRDLKAENVFINGTSGDLRIGDLGLSTVHRNGRVLSVLGTPEFMAPDMYEENSYDVKVDIYAFGMVMLEIFTKEIPYSECNNPAQIYKKVSNGDPPEVLSRLESRHAREFVKLCLGYKDEHGKFIRPSASELLKHPFLEKRESDDDEVLVNLPLRKLVISEAGESQSSPCRSPSKTRQHRRTGSDGPSNNDPFQDKSKLQGTQFLNGTVNSSSDDPNKLLQRKNSLEEYDDGDGDRFDEMPQSETNMKKVKVMMGRGQELEEDPAQEKQGDDVVITEVAALSPLPSAQGQNVATAPLPGVGQTDLPVRPQFLVAAAVIGNEGPNTRPYPDDILKLVITLPVEGQTQNVQFDFHLVEDDAVQVSREMIQELGIPLDAVLEISQTISGLARSARMRVDDFNRRMNYSNQQPIHLHPQGASQLQQIQASQDAPQNFTAVQSATPSQIHYGGHMQAGKGPQPQGVMLQGRSVSQQPSGMYVQPQQPHNVVFKSDGQHQQRGAADQHQQQGMIYSGDGQQQQRAMTYNNQAQQHSLPFSNSNDSQQQQQHLSYSGDGQQQHQHNVSFHNATDQHQHQRGINYTNEGHSQQQQQQYLPFNGPSESQLHGSSYNVVTEHHQQQQQQQNLSYGNANELQRYQLQNLSYGGPSELQQDQINLNHTALPSSGMTYDDQISHRAVSYNAINSNYGQVHVQQQSYSDYTQHPSNGDYVQHQSNGQLLQMSSHVSPAQPLPSVQQIGQHCPPVLPELSQYSHAQTDASTHSHVILHEPSAAFTQSQPSAAVFAPTQACVPDTSIVFPELPQLSTTGPLMHQSADDNNISATPLKVSQRASTAGSTHGEFPSEIDLKQRSPSNKSSSRSVSPEALPDPDLDAVSEGDPDLEEEIRKLNEEFNKNLLRAKKVFDNRMDNLQRSQIEREAQHQKTLEKHMKEQAEFEKRLAAEEEQQNRRLEQLQKEWDKKKETLAQYKRRKAAEGKALNAASNELQASEPIDDQTIPEDILPTHTRNPSSATLSQKSLSPTSSEHVGVQQLPQEAEGEQG
jgi:WNK lysine deficient protein kinase